jgi:hypothetical protein
LIVCHLLAIEGTDRGCARNQIVDASNVGRNGLVLPSYAPAMELSEIREQLFQVQNIGESVAGAHPDDDLRLLANALTDLADLVVSIVENLQEDHEAF